MKYLLIALSLSLSINLVAQSDVTGPTLLSIKRDHGISNPSNKWNVGFFVTFSETVINVNYNDFCLDFKGSGKPRLLSIEGDEATKYVTVHARETVGDIRLDLCDKDRSITDLSRNRIQYSDQQGDEVWSIDNVGPSVVTINRGLFPERNPTRSSTVEFLVTFDEALGTAVVAADFCVTNSGTGTAMITDIKGSGASRTVTVDVTRVFGRVGLNLCDLDKSIEDAMGNPIVKETHKSDQKWLVSNF